MKSLFLIALVLPLPAAAQPSPAPIATPPPPVVPTPPPLVAPASVVVTPPIPTTGYTGGHWFIRDPNDWFVLLPKARVHIDWYNFLDRGDLPAGVESNSSADPRPRDTLFIRRARVGVQGTIFKQFDFQIEGEYASAPGAGQYGTVADAFLNWSKWPWLQIMAGQFNGPFMLENRTSNRIIHYMERSIAVRSVGSPQNKDLGGMVWGLLPRNLGLYSIGVFNGENIQNIRNQDNNPLVEGRAFISPFGAYNKRLEWLKDVWVGGSFWWQRNTNLGGGVSGNVGGAAQNDLPGFTTQGGVTWLPTNYRNGTDMMGNAVRSHLVPGREVVKGAVELNVPIYNRLGLRFELVYEKSDLDQYNDVNNTNASIKRSRVRNGLIEGYGYYVEVWGWVLGDQSIIGMQGYSTPSRIKSYKAPPEPRWGLQLLFKYENAHLTVSGLPEQMDAVSGMLKPDPAVGDYSIHVLEAGINAWLTKHVRLTCNYVMNYMDGSSENAKRLFYFQKAEHELLFRAALQL